MSPELVKQIGVGRRKRLIERKVTLEEQRAAEARQQSSKRPVGRIGSR